jgi:hypothetical protein
MALTRPACQSSLIARCEPDKASYGMGISEIILVLLPKRFCIRGRHLLHIVAHRSKLPSNIVRRKSRFDANVRQGRQVRKARDAMRPRDTFSRNTMAPRESRPIM